MLFKMKETVHPEMKILSSFTQAHVALNLEDFLSSLKIHSHSKFGVSKSFLKRIKVTLYFKVFPCYMYLLK